MSVVIRKACEEEFLDVYRFIGACGVLETYGAHFYRIVIRYFRDTCYLAERDGEILGFMWGFMSQTDPRTFFLWQIGVDPSTRGEGIGGRILEAAERELAERGCNRIELTIDPSNRPSQRLFEKGAIATSAIGRDGSSRWRACRPCSATTVRTVTSACSRNNCRAWADPSRSAPIRPRRPYGDRVRSPFAPRNRHDGNLLSVELFCMLSIYLRKKVVNKPEMVASEQETAKRLRWILRLAYLQSRRLVARHGLTAPQLLCLRAGRFPRTFPHGSGPEGRTGPGHAHRNSAPSRGAMSGDALALPGRPSVLAAHTHRTRFGRRGLGRPAGPITHPMKDTRRSR